MNEPVDLTGAHTTLKKLGEIPTAISPRCTRTNPLVVRTNPQGCASSTSQPESDSVDSVYHQRFVILSRRLHPAIAAVIAHEDVTTNPRQILAADMDRVA